MTIIRITDEAPLCRGELCDRQRQCRRHLALDDKHPDAMSISSCADPAGERPLFVSHSKEAGHA